jgi:hypothetical protein
MCSKKSANFGKNMSIFEILDGPSSTSRPNHSFKEAQLRHSRVKKNSRTSARRWQQKSENYFPERGPDL